MNTSSMSACAARSGEPCGCRARSSVTWRGHSATTPTKRPAAWRRMLSMARIKLGISLRSLPWPLRRSMQEAHRIQAQGIELAAQADLAPQNLSQTGRREIRHLLKSFDLELA